MPSDPGRRRWAPDRRGLSRGGAAKIGRAISGRLALDQVARQSGCILRAVSPVRPGIDIWRAAPDAEGLFAIGGLAEGEWHVQAIGLGRGRVTDHEPLGRFSAGSAKLELRLPD